LSEHDKYRLIIWNEDSSYIPVDSSIDGSVHFFIVHLGGDSYALDVPTTSVRENETVHNVYRYKTGTLENILSHMQNTFTDAALEKMEKDFEKKFKENIKGVTKKPKVD